MSTPGVIAVNAENNNGEIWIKLIEISSLVMPTIFRYCDEQVTTTSTVGDGSTSQDYLPLPFTLPEAGEQPDNTSSTVVLQIDNIDKTLGQALMAVSVTHDIIVRSWRVLASSPNVAERASDWVLQLINGEALTLQLTLGRDPVLDEGIPYLHFTPGSNPALFHEGEYIAGALGGYIPIAPPPPPPPG